MSEKQTSYLLLLCELLKKWRGGAESAPPPITGRVNQFVKTYFKCRIDIHSKIDFVNVKE